MVRQDAFPQHKEQVKDSLFHYSCLTLYLNLSYCHEKQKSKYTQGNFLQITCLYIKKPKESANKCLELINEHIKVVRYKAKLKNQLISYIPAMRNWNLKFKKLTLA